jgi:hypothetical protein
MMIMSWYASGQPVSIDSWLCTWPAGVSDSRVNGSLSSSCKASRRGRRHSSSGTAGSNARPPASTSAKYGTETP